MIKFASRLLLACTTVVFFSRALALESPDDTRVNARIMQMPAVSATQVAFVYAGDIWVAPKGGGTAIRLSSPRGVESFPRFSPDGKEIAFSGNYDGNEDVYVMPVSGGDPRRLTHHGAADRVLGWYPDGKALLFASKMASFTDRVGQFFKVSASGGLPEKLPIPYGEFGAVSPEGNLLAFTTVTTDFATWKRYRGGMAPDIWLYNLENGAAENITSSDANDSQPMWRGRTLYFLSDRDRYQRRNIWAYDADTKAVRQVTKYTDSDVHFPSIGPDDIVFENRGRLYVLDLSSEQVREVQIEIITDRATLRPRVESVSSFIRNAAISPTGKRVLFEARGDIFSVPADQGVIRNVTESNGVAERSPAWSPDGRWIAYFSDRSGEYELTLLPADSSGPEQTITSLGAGFRYQPTWSPDSNKILFIDAAMKIHLVNRETKQTTVIDQQAWQYHSELDRFRVSWSADSRWVAYGKDQDNRQSAVVLYDTITGKGHQVTSGFYDDDMPVFDPEGRYLYYRSKRSSDPIYSEFDNTWIYANGHVLIAVPLRNEIMSPLAPRNDEEPMRPALETVRRDQNVADSKPVKPEGDDARAIPARAQESDSKKEIAMREESKPPSEPGAKSNEKSASPAPPVALNLKGTLEIDIEGFEARAVILPVGTGRYDDLLAAPGKLFYTRLPRLGSTSSNNPLCVYDIEKRDDALVVEDATEVELSADRRKLLVGRGRSWAVVNATENQRFDRSLPVGQLEMTIDPAAEWKQIFNDAWRIERDYFYDPQLHGVNWTAMRERYGKLLTDCVTRWDVNYVLGEMLGELSASHVYRGGGDFEQGIGRSVGYLGCDFTLEEGAYRISRILEAAPWDTANRGPLRQPGANVKEGDWLLAVNGRKVDVADDPWAAFQGLADRTVQLTVNSKPTMEGARTVLVQTISDETRLRQLAWIESNRKKVEQASGGKIGYIYVRNTAVEGQGELYRQFRAQFTKPAVIIDERWNSGGQIPDRFIELLGRRVTNFWGVRDGKDWQTPHVAHSGPKAMLVNGWSGSGGDCLPWMFRKASLGPVIGQRTWGGLIGMTGAPLLVDGGHVTVPTFSIYDSDGQWIIEGQGVTPDIQVIDDPAALARGEDPQLDRAIEEVKQALETNPPARPQRPAYPNRAGFAVGAN
jgi:tricorn protease